MKSLNRELGFYELCYIVSFIWRDNKNLYYDGPVFKKLRNKLCSIHWSRRHIFGYTAYSVEKW